MKAVAVVAFVLAAALIVAAFFLLATSAKAEDASTCYFIDLEKISEESVEDTRESLTWFPGDQVSGPCLHDHGGIA